MPRIQYMDFNFKASSKRIIAQALEIIGQYDFALTLRQLYYQFVQKDLIPNTQKSYKSLGGVINDARLAGLIDWNSIEDLTRDLRGNPHWHSPAQFMESVVPQYANDLWADHRRFKPPPNPAKVTDSRAKKYIAEFGTKSWELDALPPKELDRIIRQKIRSLRDDDIWEASVERQNKGRAALEKAQKAMPKE